MKKLVNKMNGRKSKMGKFGKKAVATVAAAGIFASSIFGLSGCKTEKFEANTNEQSQQQQLDDAQRRIEQLENKINDLQSKLENADSSNKNESNSNEQNQQLEDAQSKVEQLENKLNDLQSKLENSSSNNNNEKLQKELDKLIVQCSLYKTFDLRYNELDMTVTDKNDSNKVLKEGYVYSSPNGDYATQYEIDGYIAAKEYKINNILFTMDINRDEYGNFVGYEESATQAVSGRLGPKSLVDKKELLEVKDNSYTFKDENSTITFNIGNNGLISNYYETTSTTNLNCEIKAITKSNYEESVLEIKYDMQLVGKYETLNKAIDTMFDSKYLGMEFLINDGTKQEIYVSADLIAEKRNYGDIPFIVQENGKCEIVEWIHEDEDPTVGEASQLYGYSLSAKIGMKDLFFGGNFSIDYDAKTDEYKLTNYPDEDETVEATFKLDEDDNMLDIEYKINDEEYDFKSEVSLKLNKLTKQEFKKEFERIKKDKQDFLNEHLNNENSNEDTY